MRLVIVLLGTVCCWGALLLALARGVFVIPGRDIRDVAKRSGRVAVFVGFPLCFVLALGAGQMTGLIPLAQRWQHAALVSLFSLPFYSMLVIVAEVEREARWPRTPAGLTRFLSQLVVLLICGIALVVTLVALASTAGPFMGR